MKTLHRLIPFASIAVFFSSCGGEKAAEETKTQPVDTITTTEVTEDDGKLDELMDFKFHTFLANIPSPLETMIKLPEAGIAVDKSILNPIENVDKYRTSAKKALNYGVYGTDLGYMAIYDQSQEIADYFSAVKSLADELGAADQFNEALVKRFQGNMGNHDSLIVLMDKALGETEDYLKSNKRIETATLVLTGSWVESQYILVRSLIMAHERGDLKSLYEKLAEQNNHLKSLIDLLAEQGTPDTKTWKAELEKLKSVYDANAIADASEAQLELISVALKVTKDKITGK